MQPLVAVCNLEVALGNLEVPIHNLEVVVCNLGALHYEVAPPNIEVVLSIPEVEPRPIGMGQHEPYHEGRRARPGPREGGHDHQVPRLGHDMLYRFPPPGRHADRPT